MTTTPSPTIATAHRTPSLRRAELALILTLPAFIAYIALAVATVATKAESSSGELTPADISDLGATWILVHVLWMIPAVLAIAGLAALAPRAGERAKTARTGLVVVTMLLAILYLIPQVMAYSIDTTIWADSNWFATGVALSLAVGWLGTIPATVLICLGLAQRRVIPRTARTIAALAGLYLLWEIATYASIAFGSATLIDTVGPPPFLLGLLWAVLGTRLWWTDRKGGQHA